MSVAFRRESDEEHLEPKFEIPIPPGPNLVTPRGLALIGDKVATIEAQIAEATDEAAITTLKTLACLAYFDDAAVRARVERVAP